jgi:NitT/TauT family transport system substrate-binding protein
VLFGVNIHLFVLRYLEDHGIDPQQVELVNLKPQDAVVAFHRGDLDAVITWQPHVYRLQSELGDRVVVLTDDNEKYWTYKMILVAKKSYLENNGEEAIKILRALVRADDFIKSNTPKAQEILADILNLSVEEVKSFYDEIHFEVQISPRLLPMLRTEVDWLQDTLLNGKEPVTKDLRSVISNKLSTVKRSAFKIEGN